MGEDNLDNSKIHIKGGHLHIDDFAKTHLTGWSNPTLFQNKPITRRIFVTDSTINRLIPIIEKVQTKIESSILQFKIFMFGFNI